MPLVRGDEAMWVLHHGGELDCVECRHHFTADDDDWLRERIGEYSCPECGCEGFIPHHRADHKIADRFPGQLGQRFVPVVHELLEHGHEFDLNARHRMVIIALESHRFEGTTVWPSLDRLARLAGLGRATVTRVLKNLEDRGLVIRESGRKRGYAGRFTSTRYDLSPLWQGLASVAAAKQMNNEAQDDLDDLF